MNMKYPLISTALMVGLASPGVASVINGGFETGDLTGWELRGFASVITGAYGTGPTEGSYQALLQSGNGVSNTSTAISIGAIESFLGLPADSIQELVPYNPIANNVKEGSAIKQEFIGKAGHVLSFDWNFLTNEATPFNPPYPYNDFGAWSLYDQNTGALLADTFYPDYDLSSTSFKEETGFHTQVSLPLTDGHSYTLGFVVADADDILVDSALVVDNIMVYPDPSGIPEDDPPLPGAAVPDSSSTLLLFLIALPAGLGFLRLLRPGGR